MRDIIAFLGLLVFLCGDIFAAVFITEAVNSILNREKDWARLLGCGIILLALLAALFSWLPGLLGFQLSYLDGELILADGAIIRNYGIILLMHGLSLGLMLLKMLWGKLRGRGWSGKAFGLLFCFAALFCAAGYAFSRDSHIVPFRGGQGAAILALTLLGAGAFWRMIAGFKKR